jgi:dethiobiotin synthetase
MTAIFVTATGTDIGKTFVTAGLIRALGRAGRAVEALKPVISGFAMEGLAASDTGVLLDAMGRDLNQSETERISPWRFKAPLSPDMAAEAENRLIDFDALVDFSRERIAMRTDTLLIEGVGGIMVPLDATHTTLDWMAALELPVLLVAGSYLGTISHTLSALDVLDRHGLKVLSVVVSETPGSNVDFDRTVESVQRFTSAGILGLTRAGGDNPVFDRLAGLL